MPSRKSGGARQVEAKHRERDARRPRGWWSRWQRKYRASIAGKVGLDRDLAALEWAMDCAVADPGIPPEHAREQVIRAAPARGKLIDAKKLIEELMGDLREAHRTIQQLRGRRGPQVDPGDSGRPPT